MIWADRLFFLIVLFSLAALALLARPGEFVRSFGDPQMLTEFWGKLLIPALVLWVILRLIDGLMGGPQRRERRSVTARRGWGAID